MTRFKQVTSASVLTFILAMNSASAGSTDQSIRSGAAHLFSVLAPKTVVAPSNTDCPKTMSNALFDKLLVDYKAAYHDSSKALQQWDLADQVTNAVFCAVGTANYVIYLKSLDAVAPSDKNAYYDLANRLQSHWETQYALGLAKTQQSRMEKANDYSWTISVLGMGLGMFAKNPDQVSDIFSIVKKLFPVVLPAVAVGSTDLFNKYTHFGMIDKQYPLSPAHVMTLPLPAENQNYDSYQIWKDVLSATASVGGAKVAVGITAGLADAIKVGKFSFNPVTIIASWGIGEAAEVSAEEIIDEIQYHRLLSALFQQRDQIEQAVKNKDELKIRTSATDFKNAAIMLSSFLDQPSLDAWVTYDKAVQTKDDPKWKQYLGTAVQFYSGKHPEFLFPTKEDKLKSVTAASVERDKQLETIQADQDPRSLKDVEVAVTMNVLQQTPESATYLKGSQKEQADIITQGFNAMIASEKLTDDARESAYKTYISKLEENKYQEMSQDITQGQSMRNPTYVLLASAAYIQSLRDSALGSVSDDLLNIIYSGQMLQ
jgi:hypothetical protein